MGVKKYVEQPESEWLRVDVPCLRIVSDELWSTVQERLAGSKAAYLRQTRAQSGGRPTSGTESKYLLTGLAQCGHCGGSMIVTTRDFKAQGRRFYYHCGHHYLRGPKICANGLEAPMEITDREVLNAVRTDILRPRVVEAAVRKALERLRPAGDSLDAVRDAILADLNRIETEISRYTAAIGSGGDLPSLVEALRERERRRECLKDQLSSMEQARSVSEADVARLEAELRDRLADWRALLQRHPREARQILRKLLVGRLVFTPGTTETGNVYRFSGQLTLGRILAGEILPRLPIKVDAIGHGEVVRPVEVQRVVETGAPALRRHRSAGAGHSSGRGAGAVAS